MDITAAHHERIASDDDEALWEEVASQLRNHGRVSANYLSLMILGGVLTAVAFTQDTVSQAISFVAASITSPGFEPLAKMSQGIVLRRKELLTHGAYAVLAGYLSLIATAAVTFAALALAGHASAESLRAEPLVEALSPFEAHTLLPSAAAALAGGIMVASLRDTYVVGPLMILAVIPAGALTGAALAVGDYPLAGRASDVFASTCFASSCSYL